MKLPKLFGTLFGTTAMRMAIRYSLIYALILSAIFAAFLWSTESSVDEEIEAALLNERDTLIDASKQNGLKGVATLIEEKQNQSGTFLYLLTDPKGNRLAGNLTQYPEDYDSEDYETSDEVSNILFTEEILPYGQFDDDAYLVTLSKAFNDGSVLLIAHSSPQAEALQKISEYLLEFTVAAILLSLLIGVTLGYTILRRINTISHTAAKIMKGDITQRIPLSNKNDEFNALSLQLNNMMDRIQKLIGSIREVSDNVAHDLRSPLTRLRNNFEITLLEERSSKEYRQTLNQGVQDVESLIQTFNALLSIAQAESGNHRTQWKRVDLNDLLADIVELYEPLAEEKNQALSFEPHDKASIIASRNLFAQAFSNLIENAIKYTPEFGLIKILLEHDANTIKISFVDSGPGIPANEHNHVLERFVRLDNSRHTPGNGLGLSLVNAVCELHHGTLHFDNAKPGLIVIMQFPFNAISEIV